MIVTDIDPDRADLLKDILRDLGEAIHPGGWSSDETMLYQELQDAVYSAARRASCQTSCSVPSKPENSDHYPL